MLQCQGLVLGLLLILLRSRISDFELRICPCAFSDHANGIFFATKAHKERKEMTFTANYAKHANPIRASQTLTG
jgi:hypothetical protein